MIRTVITMIFTRLMSVPSIKNQGSTAILTTPYKRVNDIDVKNCKINSCPGKAESSATPTTLANDSASCARIFLMTAYITCVQPSAGCLSSSLPPAFPSS